MGNSICRIESEGALFIDEFAAEQQLQLLGPRSGIGRCPVVAVLPTLRPQTRPIRCDVQSAMVVKIGPMGTTD
jgi:hypothetical protein